MLAFYDKTMNKFIFAVCFILFVHTSGISAQAMMGPYWLYDNHYLTDKYIINPAFAGNPYDPKIFVSTQRTNVQLRDAPAIHIAGAHGRLGVDRSKFSKYLSNERKARNAFGGLVFADNNILFQTVGIKLDYAYTVPLNQKYTNLSFGLGGMFFSKRVRLDKYDSALTNDPLIAASMGNHTMIPDFNAGFLLNHHQLYVGFSVSQLLENSFQFSTLNYTPPRVYRNYYLLTGYRFVYKEFELEPSIAVGHNFAPKTYSNCGNFVDVNIEFFLKPAIFTLSYRFDGYISTSLLYRAHGLELGIRSELFSTNTSDAPFIGIGLMASYTFLSSNIIR